MRYIGGGHKRRFRIIDFKRDKDGVPAIVKTIEYDPNRSAFIALLQYKDGSKRYILAPQGLEVGKKVMSGEKAVPEVGNAMYLKDIPFGQEVHNIELHPGQGGVLARSAGTHCILDARDGKYAILKMPSGETRMVLNTCKATIGKVSNPDHNLESLGKAGRSRWIGRRPRTRAVAMNPVDHPMGGGEGKASGGHPRSRKGLYAKGLKTRKRKKLTNKFIISRRKK
jgi:large subunit ribosomal protein L2